MVGGMKEDILPVWGWSGWYTGTLAGREIIHAHVTTSFQRSTRDVLLLLDLL